MRALNLLCLLVLILVPTLSFAGSETGNGGDIVSCHPTNPSTGIEGYYTLDYLTARAQGVGDSAFVHPRSLNESLDRIQQLLDQKNHGLGIAFRSFRFHLFKKLELRSWIPSEYGLEDIKDEDITVKYPSNCYKAATSLLDIYQLVTRKVVGKKLVYYYDRHIMDQLVNSNPLQASMGIFHEFIWDLTSDIEVVRAFNLLVHSIEFDQMSDKDFYSFAESLKLFSRKEAQDELIANLNERLLNSIKEANLSNVASFLSQGADPNYTPGEQGSNTVLHFASSYANSAMVALLLQHGASPTTLNSKGESAIQRVPFFNITPPYDNILEATETVRLLLNAGCDINHQADDGRTAIYVAAVEMNWKKFSAFLSLGAKASIPAPSGGILVGMFKLLMETPAHIRAMAIGDSFWMIYLELLKSGDANINSKFSGTLTPACVPQKDPSSPNTVWCSEVWEGMETSLLTLFIDSNNLDMVDAALALGANVNLNNRQHVTAIGRTATESDWSPLRYAMNLVGDREVIPMASRLISAGAKIDDPDSFSGNTPLINAVYSGNVGTVRLLIEKGASVNFRNFAGKTALGFFRQLGYGGQEMEQVLIEAGGTE